jgi:hypothetical protein
LLDRLARGGLDRNAICDEAMGAGAEDRGVDLARLYFALGEIERKGIVRYTLAQRGHPLATLEPVAPAFRLEDVSIDGKFLLSRFACLRRVDATTRVESPLGRARVVIHDGRGAALLALLAAPHTAAELAAAMHDFDAATIAAFIALLANGKAVYACAENGRIAEDDSVPLRQWEFHDLLFHSRSRLGRHDYPYGGTYRFLDALPPLPAVKPPVSARRVALHRPDMRALDAGDVPFSRVAEARRSVRTHGEPLSAASAAAHTKRRYAPVPAAAPYTNSSCISRCRAARASNRGFITTIRWRTSWSIWPTSARGRNGCLPMPAAHPVWTRRPTCSLRLPRGSSAWPGNTSRWPMR